MTTIGSGLGNDRSKLVGVDAQEQSAWHVDHYFGGNQATYQRWIDACERASERTSWDSKARGMSWRECLADIDASEALSDEERARRASATGLNTIFKPFLSWSKEKILGAMAGDRSGRGNAPEFSEEVIASVLSGVAARLNRASLPTASLLANISRVKNLEDQSDPLDRTANFAAELLIRERRQALVGRFPCLDPRLAQITVNTTAAAIELLLRLRVDSHLIAERFGVSGPVTQIVMGLGDHHCHGRTVSLISYGEDKVIYKPRSMSIDLAFGGILDWVRGETGFDVVIPVTVDRGEYGWAEFITARECRDETEIRRAFENMGCLLGALHICGASDIHFENLIFSGPIPYAVDLETVLGAQIKRNSTSRHFQPDRAFFNSVIKVGYLPTAVRVLDRFVDLSAAGLVGEIEGPFHANVIEHSDRDDVPAVVRRGTIKPEGNSPVLNGARVPASEHVDVIVTGFKGALNAILEGRSQLLAVSGPVEAFSKTKVRHVARATAEYAQLQLNASHPSLLKSEDQLLMSFSSLMGRGAEDSPLDGLMPSEINDVLEGDVPYFYSDASGITVYNSSGEPTGVLLANTPLSVLEQRVGALSRDAISAQAHLVQRTFAVSAMVGGPTQPSEEMPISRGRGHCSDEVFLQKACDIAADLTEKAIYVDGYPHWFSPDPSGPDRWMLNVAGVDLYNGFGGIGVFFARLYKLTGQAAHREIASKCLAALRKEVRGRGTLGGYEGIAGLAYADFEIAKHLGGSPDFSYVADRLSAITEMAPVDENLDLIGGVAGALLVAVKFLEVPTLRKLAETCSAACGDRLIATAIRDESGARWQTAIIPELPLTGFSHGTAGIALALAKWGRATGAALPVEIALEALKFESHSFCEARGTWWDLRDAQTTPCAWCHGAAGMVLARIEIARCLDDEAPASLTAEIAKGLSALQLRGGGGNHSLCHGLFGNIAPILKSGDRQRARKIAAEAVAQSDAEGRWRTGVSEFEWSPGLMTGVAGIGVGLLSLIDVDEPDVLVLG